MLTPVAEQPALRFAILRSSSIGDVVLATACLDLIKVLPMPVHVTWLGKDPSLSLLAKSYPEVEFIEVNPESANYIDVLVSKLKSHHFVLDLQVSLRSKAICRALSKAGLSVYSCDKRVLQRGKAVLASRIRGRRSTLPEVHQGVNFHQFEVMADALRMAIKAHLPVDQCDALINYIPKPFLPTSHDNGEHSWQKELKFGKWLAIAPGASYPTKVAPEELFINILRYLRDRSSSGEIVGLVFVGGEDDRAKATKIIDLISWPGVVLNLAGKLSLWDSCLAIKESKAIISNDSSLCHIAEAVGVPSLVLFGPTVESFGFAPWRKDSKAFSVPLGCRPCSKHGKTECRYKDKLCFNSIDLNEVTKTLTKILEI